MSWIGMGRNANYRSTVSRCPPRYLTTEALTDGFHLSVKALKGFYWTKSLKRLSFHDSKQHTADITKRLPGNSYLSDLVYDMNPYVDIDATSPSSDPFRRFLSNHLPEVLTAEDREQQEWHAQFGRMGLQPVPTRMVPAGGPIFDAIARFLVALIGGALLMAPIIAMSFVDSQNMRLVIASIFVVGFSIILSFVTSASNQEIIGGSAAYAAVIVVFVGSALSTSSG